MSQKDKIFPVNPFEKCHLNEKILFLVPDIEFRDDPFRESFLFKGFKWGECMFHVWLFQFLEFSLEKTRDKLNAEHRELRKSHLDQLLKTK